jgi:hypothetical protein
MFLLAEFDLVPEVIGYDPKLRELANKAVNFRARLGNAFNCCGIFTIAELVPIRQSI